MRRRLAILSGIWILFAGWLLRVQATLAGSPVPGGYGVNIDWTRHQVATTGYATRTWEPLTVTSSYAGAQNYDLASYVFANINVVTGVTGLDQSLVELNLLPLVGLVIFPAVFLGTMRRVEKPFEPWDYLLVLALVLFPAATTVLKTSDGWYTEVVASAVLVYLLCLTSRLKQSRVHVGLFSLFGLFLLRLYHTWVFLTLLVVGVAVGGNVVIGAALDEWDSPAPWWIPALTVPPALGLLVISGRLEELVWTLSRILFTDYFDTFYSAAGSSLIESDITSTVTSLNARRILKLFNYGATISIVAMYVLTRTRATVRAVRAGEPALDSPLDRTVFVAMFAFPVVLAVFFLYGGLGAAIGRTQYVGVYVAILAVILLLGSERRSLRRLTAVLVVIIVLTAVPATQLSGIAQPPHTVEQAAAIEHTGTHVDTKEYVFSTASLGPPLTYYDIAGVSMVRVDHPEWESNARAIYFGDDPGAATAALRNSIESNQIHAAPVSGTYLLLSSDPAENGVPLYSFVTKPTPDDPRVLYRDAPGYQKVYTSGKQSLFYYHFATAKARGI